MNYEGINASELSNVTALNAVFLAGIRARSLRPRGLPTSVAGRLYTMGPVQRKRLAQVPFLLYSLRENESQLWAQILSDNPTRTISDGPGGANSAQVELVSATLGFLWQLSSKNPYAARLLSGANLGWCEALVELPIIELLQRAATSEEMLTLRCGDSPKFWNRLLDAATSNQSEVRRAARIRALQCVLTRTGDRSYQPLASAACRLPPPPSRVADR